jgi:hypothetical protein
MNSYKVPRFRLSIVVAIACSNWLQPIPGQVVSGANNLPWKKTLVPAAKGTHSRAPASILKDIKANPDDCMEMEPSQEDLVRVDAYRVRRGNRVLIALQGRGSCFCSPTGNCQFWLYGSQRGRNSLLLQTEMVQVFGFLPSVSLGLPDLVLWSHDSAQSSPGTLWRFNGREYVSECSWEVVRSFADRPDGTAEWAESHIENSNCKQKLVPQTTIARKTSSPSPK